MLNIRGQQKNKGILLAIFIGFIALIIKRSVNSAVFDPLVVAMILGILIRSFFKFSKEMVAGLAKVPETFIPLGVILYGAVNLNFTKIFTVDTSHIFLLFIVFIVYIVSAVVLSSLFGLNEKTGYLIATGSAICGASAITIASKAIDAEPDDVSISLLPVFLSALIGLFIVLPFIRFVFSFEDMGYGVLAGTVLQFTGFVKASVAGLPAEVKTIALSIKAIRYVGLLLVIPLFASFVKGKMYFPWYLWCFLGAGVLCSFAPDTAAVLRPTFKLILNILWSIAMAAIGLNANLKDLFTKRGLRAFFASFISFMLAVSVFIIGTIYI
ncbi:MAG: putative sulfate exporter family transporter [Candidatus Zapsychrus exili]|nr:putative sulfate exporter family transporter [Candidatus Zapsychrus exili]